MGKIGRPIPTEAIKCGRSIPKITFFKADTVFLEYRMSFPGRPRLPNRARSRRRARYRALNVAGEKCVAVVEQPSTKGNHGKLSSGPGNR